MIERAIAMLNEQQRGVKERSAPLDGGGAAEGHLPARTRERSPAGKGLGKSSNGDRPGGEKDQGLCRRT